jgi:exopolysaccharide biosynthesis polyprenyl glycosylphosphotransferase
MVVDAITIAAAMTIAFFIWFTLVDRTKDTAAADHLVVAAATLPIWIAFFSRYRLYTAREVSQALREFEGILHACVAGALTLAVVGFAWRLPLARGWVVLSGIVAIVVVTIERSMARQVFTALRKRGKMSRPVVIVGANTEAVRLCRELEQDRSLGYRVLGFVDDHWQQPDRPWRDHAVLGTIDKTLEIVDQVGAEGVVVATTAVDAPVANRLARLLPEAGVHVEMSSSLHDIAAERVTSHALGPFAMLYVSPTPHSGWRVAAKRGLDVMVSAIGLIALSPVLAVAAVAIVAESGRPVLFAQLRVGRDGGRFSVRKLRTMVVDADAMKRGLADRNEADGPLFKIRNDPRVTRVGRVLRRTCIDEIPQLWNVLRGEMSLVGPRPALAAEMVEWSPDAYKRLRVKPGLTGMWQIARKADHSFDDYIRLDLFYVDNWSLWRDLSILVRTVPTIIRGTATY